MRSPDSSKSRTRSSKTSPRGARAKPRSRQPPAESSATAAGFHLLDLYLNCQWKWFIRHVLGIEPKGSPLPLIFGGAFHHGKAIFYLSKGNAEKALDEAEHYFYLPEIELEDEDQKEPASQRVRTLLAAWINTWGRKDFSRYDFLGVEQNMSVAVPGLKNFRYTGRLDAVVKDRSNGKVLVLETKTSGYSITLTADAVLHGDQATGYVWLAQELHGKIDGVLPDIAYWSRSASNPKAITCARPFIVTRTPEDVSQFQLGLMQCYSEISQKMEALSSGKHDPRALFLRNTHYCVAYGHVCEYADDCRSKRFLEGRHSILFRKSDKRPALARLADPILDRMAVS